MLLHQRIFFTFNRPGLGPFEGFWSRPGALQGYEAKTMELLGGMEENSVSLISGSLICPLGKSKIFYHLSPVLP